MAATTSISTANPYTLTTPSGPSFFEGFPSLRVDNIPSSVSSPYLICNEEDQEETLQALPKKLTQDRNAVHVGFSVYEFNFDVMAQTKPALAIICDIDPHVIELYKACSSALKKCENPLDFAENMNEYIRGKPFTTFDFKEELERKGCWLSTRASYHYIRQMEIEGRIYFGYLDLSNKEDRFGEIAHWFEGKNLYVQTLYISNIFVWLKKANKETLTQGSLNIQKLIDHRTHTIHAFSPQGNEKNSLRQEVVVGMEGVTIADTIWDLNYVPPPPKRSFRTENISVSKFVLPEDE